MKPPATTAVFAPQTPLAQSRPGAGVVQPVLSIGKKGPATFYHIEEHEINAFIAEVQKNIAANNNVSQDFDRALRENPARLRRVISKWINAPEHRQGAQKGVLKPERDSRGKLLKARERAFEDWESFAVAAAAESRAFAMKAAERQAAREVVVDPQIRDLLVKVVEERIPAALMQYDGVSPSDIEKLKGKNARVYLPYVSAASLAQILANPRKANFQELVAAIHDVQEILYHARNDRLILQGVTKEEDRNKANVHALPAERYQGTVYEASQYVRKPVDRAWRGPQATPRPSNPHVATALALGNPTDMGPSMTAARMFILAEHGRATPTEMAALARAIFAFWNRAYRRDITDIHRYHNTMDMAANFGVPYNAPEISRSVRQPAWQSAYTPEPVPAFAPVTPLPASPLLPPLAPRTPRPSRGVLL